MNSSFLLFASHASNASVKISIIQEIVTLKCLDGLRSVACLIYIFLIAGHHFPVPFLLFPVLLSTGVSVSMLGYL